MTGALSAAASIPSRSSYHLMMKRIYPLLAVHRIQKAEITGWFFESQKSLSIFFRNRGAVGSNYKVERSTRFEELTAQPIRVIAFGLIYRENTPPTPTLPRTGGGKSLTSKSVEPEEDFH
ncbi:MAG: hypothetical protein AUK25_03940 [Desulfobacteraceae bacterium CG2_30_51_40]|nr:MAG: hypothetical protein AUK25_03940 [Desulfobacteraceae bacterium CG2_30_51_40]